MPVRSLFIALLGATFGFVLPGQGIITSIAGTDWLFQGNGGPALSAPLGRIERLALDSNGNLFVSDPDNSLVFEIAPNGILTVVAGNGTRQYSGDNGPASLAGLSRPHGIAVDAAGNLYIADGDNPRIRKVSPNGTISTVAGIGQNGFNGDNIPATSAMMFGPSDVALDGAGNIYIADTGNNRIRKIAADTGLITTIAGTGTRDVTGDGGPAVKATLNEPAGVFVDSKGQVFIADTGNGRIRRIGTDGVIQTVAGDSGYLPAEDGVQATKTSLRNPLQVTVDAAGVVYFADSSQSRIRKVTSDGIISTVAGTGTNGFAGEGGNAAQAQVYGTSGVAVDPKGIIYIADTTNSRVRRIALSGMIQTIAGNGTYKFGGDGGVATAGLLNAPNTVAMDASGNLYVSDTLNHRVRKITSAGIISTVAGNGLPGFTGDGGPATSAALDTPIGVAVDSSGNLWIADSYNQRIRKVDSATGIINTVIGGGSTAADGPPTQVGLAYPSSLAFDRQGNLYLTETFRVRKMAAGGNVTTVAGTGAFGPAADGGPATSSPLGYLGGVALDSKNNIYFAEIYAGRVHKVGSDGILTTYAGSGTSCCSGDGGPATRATIDAVGLALDSADSLYIGGAYSVRKVTLDGTISTVAGGGSGANRLGDGGSALAATLNNVNGVGVDGQGNLLIADTGDDRIRSVLNVQPPFQVAPAAITFTGVSGGVPSVEQDVVVTSQVANLAFTTSRSDGSGWLGIQPATGLAPGTVQLTADPTGLAPGSYEATLIVTAPTANPAVRTVAVRFDVSPAPAPLLVAEPLSFNFDFVQGAQASAQTLLVRNNGGGNLAVTVSSTITTGANWLSITPGSGTATASAPVEITVTATPGALAAGTYAGLITVQGDSGKTILIPVSMTVHSSAQTLLLSRDGLFFTAVAGASVVFQDSFFVLNTGTGTLNWTAQADVLSGNTSWLSISPSTGASGPGGTSAGAVNVSANPAGLAVGDYYGRITVASPTSSNGSQVLSVVLRVTATGTPLPPDVRPTGFLFVNSDPQDGLILNASGAPNSFQSAQSSQSGVPFFTHQPLTASLPPGQPVRISVQPTLAGLAPGVQRGNITLQFANGTTRLIDVVAVIPATAGNAPASTIRGAGGCTPTGLTLVFTLLGQVFQVPASFPASIEVRVADDCGNLFNAGSVVISFSNGDVPLSLVPIGSGRWAGTWQPGVQSSNLRITAVAEDLTRTLRGTAQVSGSVVPNPLVPIITSGSVVNGASLSARTPIAPGAIISIFGQNLADGTAEGGVPRDTVLSGTLAVLGGVSLPLLYVSPAQINAIVPYGIPVNTSQQLLVQRGTNLTLPVPIPIALAQPGVFTVNGTGAGQGHVYDSTGKLVDATNPAKAGDAIVIYCAGLGPVDQAVFAGFPAPSDPLARTGYPVQVTIGGSDAQVLFAGLAPQFTGLYQINAVVPAGVAAEGSVSLVITVAGQISPPVTFAVR
jgi:uncharacterized protein (TIGR03437 family)